MSKRLCHAGDVTIFQHRKYYVSQVRPETTRTQRQLETVDMRVTKKVSQKIVWDRIS